MLQKSGKPPIEVKSCQPISLLPTRSELLKKRVLKKLRGVTEKKADTKSPIRVQSRAFDTRQVHRITGTMEKR